MPKPQPSVGLHKDGTIWNKGQTLDGKMHGYWEFFRKDGVIMRSGSFDRGEQVGEWTTYDKAGKLFKVTQMKAAGKQMPTKKAPAKKGAKTSAKVRKG